MSNPIDPALDKVGRVESAGVEYIPEHARDSNPRNVFAVMLGANLAWSLVIFGWLPVTLGLNFWGAFTSTLIGVAIGSVLLMPVALMGPQTGTNMTVASSAFFGIRGRLIGSVMSLFMVISYAAIAVWTSGDAIVAAAHRLLELPENNWVKAAAYAVVSAGIVAVALYGHATIVAMQKVIIPIVGGLLIVGVFAFAPEFDPAATPFDYVLGGYWQTWILSMVLGIASPITYVTMIGDYTRRIPQFGFTRWQTAGAVGGGLFVGNMLPMTFGMFTAVMFVDPTDSYVADLVAMSPTWYILPIIVIAILGGLGQGVMNVYASGLDLEGLFPRLRRFQTTVITASIAIVLLYVGVFAVSAIDSITALTLVVNAVAVPWATIMIIGALRHRRTGYDPLDLQAFAQGRRGGRYWFTGGWNVPTVAAWLSGSVFGVLSVACQLYVGPFADLAGGIDLSCAGSGAITALVYVVLTGMQAPTASAQTPLGPPGEFGRG